MENVLEGQSREPLLEQYNSFSKRYPNIKFWGLVGDVSKLPPLSDNQESIDPILGYSEKPIFTDNFPDHVTRRAFRENLLPEDREVYERNALRVNNIIIVFAGMEIACIQSPVPEELKRVYLKCIRRFKSPYYYDSLDTESKIRFARYLARQCNLFKSLQAHTNV